MDDRDVVEADRVGPVEQLFRVVARIAAVSRNELRLFGGGELLELRSSAVEARRKGPTRRVARKSVKTTFRSVGNFLRSRVSNGTWEPSLSDDLLVSASHSTPNEGANRSPWATYLRQPGLGLKVAARRFRKAWSMTEAAKTPMRRVSLLGAWGAETVEERLLDAYYRRKGLDTAAGDFVQGSVVGAGGEQFQYFPTQWRALRKMFPRGSLGPDDVLMDCGSGKGRVAIWVACHFRLFGSSALRI